MKVLLTTTLITISFFCFANTQSIADSNAQTPIEITQKRNIIQFSEIIFKWSIVSKNGQIVLSGSSTNSISLESLPIGAYLLKVEDQESKILAIKKIYKF